MTEDEAEMKVCPILSGVTARPERKTEIYNGYCITSRCMLWVSDYRDSSVFHEGITTVVRHCSGS